MKVIGIGDNVVDQYTHIRTRYPGGNALNFSVYAARLGCPSAYMGVFGDDAAAAQVKAALAQQGVDASRCRQVSGENGWASLTITDGERIFLGSNQGGVSRLTSMDFVLAEGDYVRDSALIHTGSYGYLDAQLPALSRLGVPVSYDFSDDFHLPAALALCHWVDYGFFSCAGSTLAQSEEILRRAVAAGCGCAVATRGDEEAVSFDGRRWYRQMPLKVSPVDTLGAGDAFITAFLLDYLQLIPFSSGSGDRAATPAAALASDFSVSAETRMAASLARAAAFAAEICLEEGAFGYGQPY